MVYGECLSDQTHRSQDYRCPSEFHYLNLKDKRRFQYQLHIENSNPDGEL